MEKPYDDVILELENLLNQGGRPSKEEKESITLRISLALARKAKIAYPDERSRIYEEALIRQLRKDGHLPPPLDLVKTKGGGRSAHAHFNPPQGTDTPDQVLDSPFNGKSLVGKILKEQDEKPRRPKK